jgi:2'-5' RNA ligase
MDLVPLKKQRRTNVIWLGLKNTEVLSKLAKEVDRSMHNFGFELETRPFKAHLTLGRVKYISNEARLESYVDEFKGLSFQVADIDEIILFESVLQQTGPKYKIIEKLRL